MEEFPKKSWVIPTYDEWNFKPQISSIFHFDQVSEGRMAHVLSKGTNIFRKNRKLNNQISSINGNKYIL